MIRFILTRYIAYAFIFLEVLLIPTLLSPSVYADYEYLKNLLNLITFVLLGSHTGYLYFTYTRKKNYFASLFKVVFYVLLIAGLTIGIIKSSIILFIPSMCIGISVIFEKKLQTGRHFFLAILFKPICSIFLVCTIYLSTQFFKTINVSNVLAIALLLSVITWEISARFTGTSIGLENIWRIFSIRKIDFIKFYAMVKAGITENMATIILSLHLFIDRYFFKHYHTAQLPAYSLAFNFSQFVFIGINSLAYIQAINLGENFSTLKVDDVKSVAKRSVLLFLGLLVGVLALSFFYDRWFHSFDGFLKYTFVLSFFVGLFYTLNITSVVVLFAGKQYQATFIIAVAFIINLALSYIFVIFHVPPILFVLKTAALLFISGLAIYIMSVKIIANRHD